ncbi:MAG: twin-arginine translocase TatA/TatE family subunit [Clostridia bacterium]|nr:twin-arginine translocase TatA/TatE family subunit [Clostridia bacterium]
MFNIGFSELILILLVAFVIVGPRDLPKVAAALGRGVRTIRQFVREFQDETGIGDVVDEFKRTSRDLEKTFKEVDPTEDLKQAQKDVEDAVRSTAEAARDTLDLNK